MPKKLIMFAFLASLLVASLLMFVIPVSAAGFKFSGTFDGTEAEAVLPSCGVLTSYDVVGSVQVSVSGDYNYSSISSYDEVAISADVYVNSFDSANPATNHIASPGRDGILALTAGTNYVFVVHPHYTCGALYGNWAFMLAGAGTVSGGNAIRINSFSGSFDGGLPWAFVPVCNGGRNLDLPTVGAVPYDLVGPIRVEESGAYVFLDLARSSGVSIWGNVYFRPMDPSDPLRFLNGDLGTARGMYFLAGYDYYLVITPRSCSDERGIWEFSLTGGSSLELVTDERLNPGLGDIDAVLVGGRDDDGGTAMNIYCVDQLSAEGFLALVITQDDLPRNPVRRNTLLLESDTCEGSVEFYALAAGGQYAYQVNVGPNIEGTVHEYLFNDISGQDLIMRTFNLYELGD